MEFATPREVHEMAKSLKRDATPIDVKTDVAGLTALIVCVLATHSAADIPDQDAAILLEIARFLADVLEEKRPDVEPWIATVFGVAALRRGAR